MGKYRKLTHVVYKSDYHIVFTPKYRFRIMTGQISSMLEHDIKTICEWKDVVVEELNIQIDHIHMIVSIPPRVSVSDFMGILKGKTAIKLFKSYPKLKKKPYWGNHFWARGYFENTVGLDEEMIRCYVKYQEDKEREAEQDRQDFTLF